MYFFACLLKGMFEWEISHDLKSQQLLEKRESLSQSLLNIHAYLAPYTSEQEGLLGKEFQDVADAYALLCKDLQEWKREPRKD